MRFHRFAVCFAALAASTALAASGPDYVSTVQRGYTPSAQVKRVAILPVVCPPELECDRLEEEFAELLADRIKLEVVPAQQARDVMERAHIDKLDYETRFILAESLRVDAFATVNVRQASIEKVESKVAKVGFVQMPQQQTTVKHVKLGLQLESKDGSVLMQTDGEARVEGTMKGLNGVAERTLEVMLDKAVPQD